MSEDTSETLKHLKINETVQNVKSESKYHNALVVNFKH